MALTPFVFSIRRSRQSRPTFDSRRFLERLEQRVLFSTYTVTNLADHGIGSMRQAILNANAHAGTDNIVFSSGLHGTIGLLSGQLTITGSVSITGPGANALAVSGNNLSRVLQINGASTSVSISGLTITRGNPGLGFGGGVLNYGGLTLANDTLSNNVAASLKAGGVYGGGGGLMNFGVVHATAATFQNNAVYAHDTSSQDGGGAVYNAGSLVAANCVIKSNSALISPSAASNSIVGGGGVFNRGGAITSISATTIANNQVNISNGASDFGGGVENRGTLTVSTSTISGNRVNGGNTGNAEGGGVYNTGNALFKNATICSNTSNFVDAGISQQSGTLTLVNSTVALNVALYICGGIELDGGTLEMGNTILADNQDSDDDGAPKSSRDLAKIFTSGTVDSLGHNLVGGIGGADDLFGPTDIVGKGSTYISAKLGPLASNGGPTQTLAIGSTSPAHNAGSNAIASKFGLTTDQRGKARIDHGIVDIGAFEA